MGFTFHRSFSFILQSYLLSANLGPRLRWLRPQSIHPSTHSPSALACSRPAHPSSIIPHTTANLLRALFLFDLMPLYNSKAIKIGGSTLVLAQQSPTAQISLVNPRALPVDLELPVYCVRGPNRMSTILSSTYSPSSTLPSQLL